MSFKKPFDFTRLGPNDDIFKRFGVDTQDFKNFTSLANDKTWQEMKAKFGRIKEDIEKEFSAEFEDFAQSSRPSTSKNHSFFQQEEDFPLNKEWQKSQKQYTQETSSKGSKVHFIPVSVEPRDSEEFKAPQTLSKSPPCPKPKEHKVPFKTEEEKSSPSPLQKSTTIRNFSSHNQMGSNFGKFSHGAHGQPPSASASKTAKSPDPMKLIHDVSSDLEDLKKQVGNFPGGDAQSKEYRYLDEMLTRCILRLDNIDTCGKESIRNKRKNVIQEIQICISLLESKVRIETPNVDNAASFGTVIALPDVEGGAHTSEAQKDSQEHSFTNKVDTINYQEEIEDSTNLEKSCSNHHDASKVLTDSDKITETITDS